ncbi:MAG: DUF3592 domain-containing protein [Thermoguttaceae bacterium]|nr:DUF3592 domain-containing protein [Thermoguttaceae bacterium]
MRTQSTCLTRYPKYLLLTVLLGGGGLVLFMIGLMVTIRAAEFHKTAQKTTAVITSLSRNSSGRGTNVYVDYEIDGMRYEKIPLGYYHSSMACGDIIEIEYAPQDPSKIQITGFAGMLLPLILFGLGGFDFLVGLGFLIYVIQKERRRMWLMRYGNVVRAKMIRIHENRWVKWNGTHPYFLECVWQASPTATPRYFRSEEVRICPPLGSEVTVYIDPRNDRSYYVDTFC